jgi:hypothetical protein
MPWEIQTQKPCSHPSRPDLPSYYGSNTSHMVGDIWRCDDCTTRFQVDTHKVTEGMSWDQYQVTKLKWTPLYKGK